MEQDTEATLTMFRVWNGKEGGVIALFPEVMAVPYRNLCLSYEHIGQHGSADYHGCIQRTRPAQPTEYAPLRTELESIGYRLKVRQRWNRVRVRG